MSGYNIAPKPGFLLAMANQRWTVAGAVSELVDNSTGELRGNADLVEIKYDTRKRILTVFDNGQGMKHIGDLFRLGETIGMGPRDIGRYGSGGTMALIWLADKVTIHSMRKRLVCHDTVSWKEIMEADSLAEVFINDRWERATMGNTPMQLFEAGHGTLIEMHVRPERIFQANHVQQELGKAYAPAVRHGKVLKWITLGRGGTFEQTISDTSLVLPTDPEHRIDFNLVIKTPEGDRLPVEGSVGLIDDLPFSQSNVAIGFGPRVIYRTRECYESHKADIARLLGVELDDDEEDVRYSGNGVAGWLDLGDGWQKFLTTTKDGITDDRIRITLMQHVFDQIRPLLEKTEEERLAVVFEGIALELEGALNDLAMDKFKVESAVAKQAGGRRGPDEGVKPEPDPDNPIPDIQPKQEKIEGEQPEERPPVSRISIHRETDSVLHGGLCRMEVISQYENTFRIEVNKDHPVVQSILMERPMQKVALHLMLTREMASALLQHDVVAKRVLPEDLIKRLEQIEDADGLQRERTLARILMDSARRPRPDNDDDNNDDGSEAA
jgi:hypothetical protein